MSSSFVTAVGVVLAMGGLVAVAATRNLVRVLIGLQSLGLGAILVLSSAGLSSAFSPTYAVVLAASAAAAMEAASIIVVVVVYRKFKTSDPRRISELKW
ncbi:MAG: NADH-quinone oxidoreductase subunit K [Fervidicoccaceae archaeon]